MKINAILEQVHRIILEYREEMKLGVNEFAEKADLPTTAFVNIEKPKIGGKGKIQTIKLDTLLKVFNAYPEIGTRFCSLVMELLSKKHTDDGKKLTPMQIEIEIKRLIEAQLDMEGRLRKLEKKKAGVTG